MWFDIVAPAIFGIWMLIVKKGKWVLSVVTAIIAVVSVVTFTVMIKKPEAVSKEAKQEAVKEVEKKSPRPLIKVKPKPPPEFI